LGNPGSIVPSIGASGAIAGLMGAFLVRFPKMKIRMMWFFDLGLFPFLASGCGHIGYCRFGC
jgi:membrane associated rhomboid family serine protease